jgi:hypothetical protein
MSGGLVLVVLLLSLCLLPKTIAVISDALCWIDDC